MERRDRFGLGPKQTRAQSGGAAGEGRAREADKPGCRVSEDRVEANFMSAREDYVRERITQVARTIQFMDVTGLVPSSREIYGFRTCSKSQRLPGQDHATTWQDPVTKALVMMDEPYGYVDQFFTSRNHWAEANGFCLRRVTWPGTYRPRHGTVCDPVNRAGQGDVVILTVVFSIQIMKLALT